MKKKRTLKNYFISPPKSSAQNLVGSCCFFVPSATGVGLNIELAGFCAFLPYLFGAGDGQNWSLGCASRRKLGSVCVKTAKFWFSSCFFMITTRQISLCWVGSLDWLHRTSSPAAIERMCLMFIYIYCIVEHVKHCYVLHCRLKLEMCYKLVSGMARM